MDGRSVAIGVFLAVVPAMAMLWQARRNTRQDLLQDWANAHYLVVPAGHRDAIAGYLRRMVWAQGIGAAGGWIVGASFPVPGGPWGGIFVGYIVSAVVAETTAQRRLGTGVASLAPRRLEAYVPPAALVAARMLVGVALAIGVIPLFVDRHPSFSGRDLAAVAATALGIAIIGLGGEWSSRRVVARRQTAGTAELLAVDDALRSSSAHLLVASMLGAELLGLSALAGRVASVVAPEVLRWVGFILAAAFFLAAIVTLHRLAGRPWRVRRSVIEIPA